MTTRTAAVAHPSLLCEASPGLHMGVSLIAGVCSSERAEGTGAPGERKIWGGGFIRLDDVSQQHSGASLCPRAPKDSRLGPYNCKALFSQGKSCWVRFLWGMQSRQTVNCYRFACWSFFFFFYCGENHLGCFKVIKFEFAASGFLS